MKPEGRLITCVGCGETGVLAGGLRKVDGKYKCNNRQKCEAILAEKRAILAERKPTQKVAVIGDTTNKDLAKAVAEAGLEVVKVPSRYYCTACRKHHVKTSKVGKEHTNFYLKEMPNANKRTKKG